MMYITIYHKDGVHVERTWHTGTPFPFACSTIEQAFRINVQADGDELEHVLANCNNIPTTNRRVQTWSGDFARFISANLALNN
jgi:hypothetical protein